MDGRLGRALRGVPAHVLLVAAAPVLLLWALNAGEVRPSDALPVLAVVCAGAVVVTAIAALVARDLPRGALVASTVTAVVLVHGHLWGTGTAARIPGLLVAAVAVVAVVRGARTWDDDTVGRSTAVANVVGVLLVALAAPGVIGSVRAAVTVPDASTDTAAADADTSLTTPDGSLRDIVWIVPDRYGGEPGLASTFGIDAEPFSTALRDRGFVVAEDARADYPRTSHSLAAQLNLDTLDGLAATIPDGAQDDVTPLYAMLEDHEVGRILTAAGYEYDHLASWWGPTASATSADRVLRFDETSEFVRVFEETTILPALGIGTGGTDLTGRERIRATTEWQLDELDRIAAELAADTDDAPRFVFAHVALPHEPYVFDRDGTWVDAETERSRDRADNFGRQLAYLDDRLLDLVDTLAAAGPDEAPVVLIQADEGPHPAELEFGGRTGWAWSDRPVEDLVTKLSILSAVRMPGADAEALVPDDVTGVNTVRLVMDTYLGTGLGPLPDRSYIYPDEQTLYRFTDVTDQLDAAIAEVDTP